ncbi:hypothetical protein JTB14_033914 [Gonioctena quinquepunctata]|nr:hypothetical protein JTB14_033914 [Gonioctena quinquepunctata]
MTHGGYIAYSNPFPEEYHMISYMQSYDPTYHSVCKQRGANSTLYTIFNDYSACMEYIKRKTKFIGNFVSSHHHRLERMEHRLSLRLEIVVNFETYEVAIADLQDNTIYVDLMERIFLEPTTDDDEEDKEEDAATEPILLATFRDNWYNHVTTT